MTSTMVKPSQPNSQELCTEDLYRSNLYAVNTGINPLVSAAQPILSLLHRLEPVERLSEPAKFKQQVEHELTVFAHLAKEAEFSDEVILVARYLLSACLDEKIQSKQWDSITDYMQIGRFTPQSIDGPDASERFFMIMDKLFAHPESHLELLELCYLVLSFGFEGNSQQSTFDRSKLDEIIDKAYALIKQHRGELHSNFLISSKLMHSRHSGIKPLSLTLLIVFMLTTVGGVVFGFNYFLGKHVSQYTSLTKSEQHG